MRKMLPLGLNAALVGLTHQFMSLTRTLTRRSSSHFADALRSDNHAIVNAGKICHLCGYDIVNVTLENGWRMQGCSATMIPELVSGRKLGQWSGRLSPDAVKLRDAHREAQLQTSSS